MANTVGIIKKLASMGTWEQLNQLQEECGEVVRAVNKLRRKKPNSYVELCEEIADLKIMLLQMDIILDGDLIESIFNQRLIRIEERIANGKL